jgi:hypothetical protein
MERFERRTETPKVFHAEPLFIDLIRDLGARKGEAEWNFGFGLTDNQLYDEYQMLVEYEWAPRDHLGLEIELPVTLHTTFDRSASVPPNQLESLKLATQWTVRVDTAQHVSLAVGYLHEFLLPSSLNEFTRRPLAGHLFNPFGVAAKRWGTSWHTLLYAGPRITRLAGAEWEPLEIQANWNVHYMLPNTRNFIGAELNQSIARRASDVVIRPQMRLGINDSMLMGLAVGVPINRERERLGVFMRLIYEPGHGAGHRTGAATVQR